MVSLVSASRGVATAPMLLPERLADRFLALPADRPFTTAEGLACGLSHADLRRLVHEGLLNRPMRGVYVGAAVADTLDVRLAALRLVVPEDCVVTDRTAAWLWAGDMLLAPGDHLVVPRVTVFCPPGLRLRNGLADSGERRLRREDVAELDGLRVTRPLRTACDLGRLLHRDQGLAVLDRLSALGEFTLDELVDATTRFKGYRGVVQLRVLVSVTDPRAESPGESVLRLRWLDVGLPRPECQVEVESARGGFFYIDIGLPELRFGAEYDGEAFHGPERLAHDEDRRAWLRDRMGWHLEVARRDDVHGSIQLVHMMLRRGFDQALKTHHQRRPVTSCR